MCYYSVLGDVVLGDVLLLVLGDVLLLCAR
jgi:hypothetical protein